jgi:hypothetical protein
MREAIKFEEAVILNPITRKKQDVIAVIRDGHQVALLPDPDRLRRALNLPLGEVEHIVANFSDIMNREPSQDEKEFWQAVPDFKRNQRNG